MEVSHSPQQLPRDKRAQDALDFALGDAVGRRYVDKYFPASSKRDIQAMVANIKAALEKRIDAIDWMAAETKARSGEGMSVSPANQSREVNLRNGCAQPSGYHSAERPHYLHR